MDRSQEKHYEELFNKLLERGEILHASNRKRIRIGLIFLAVFTVGMILIRYMTESDRATFLIIWVIGMFAISIYLIAIEYIDNSIERTLEDVTERDTGWGELIPDSEAMRDLIQDRVQDRREEIEERLEDRRVELEERIQSRRSELQGRLQDRLDAMSEEAAARAGMAGSREREDDE